jgi:hypothetical protein
MNADDENKGAIITNHGDDSESLLYNVILSKLNRSHEKCNFPWLTYP